MLTLLIAATTTALGQDVNSYIELLRSDVKTQAREIITESMHFDEHDASAFWPIYRDYEFELGKLGDARIALIKEYAANYDSMTDKKAEELMNKVMKFQEDRLKLKKKYFKKIAKALSATTAAKFTQVDNELQLLIDLQIASQLPLVKKPTGKAEMKK